MAITYTREQRDYAKEEKLHLASVAALGFEFQGPVPEELAKELLDFALQFIRKRSAWAKSVNATPVAPKE